MALNHEKAKEYGKKGAAARWSGKAEKRVEPLNLRLTVTEREFVKKTAKKENLSQADMVLKALETFAENQNRGKVKC
jgi:hypothetical protein